MANRGIVVALAVGLWASPAVASHPCPADAGPCDCCHGSECPPQCFDGAAGAGGSAGSAGSGGGAGSAGSGGSSGSAGSAGSTSGSAGAAGSGGSSGSNPEGGEGDDGCDCRMARSGTEKSWWAPALLALFALRRRARRS